MSSRITTPVAMLFLLASLTAAAPVLTETCFTAVDIETTGLSPKRDRVVEVTAIRFRGTNVISSNTWLINPCTNIPPRSTAVHRITDSMVKDQPPFLNIATNICANLTNSIVVAHNARFDWSFLCQELSRAGVEPPDVQVIDSLKWSKQAIPSRRSYALRELSKDLNFHTAPTHRSESDTMALVELVQHCIRTMPANSTTDALGEFSILPKQKE